MVFWVTKEYSRERVVICALCCQNRKGSPGFRDTKVLYHEQNDVSGNHINMIEDGGVIRAKEHEKAYVNDFFLEDLFGKEIFIHSLHI